MKADIRKYEIFIQSGKTICVRVKGDLVNMWKKGLANNKMFLILKDDQMEEDVVILFSKILAIKLYTAER